MIGIIPIMKKPSFRSILTAKPAMPTSLDAAAETIPLLHETIASLSEQARQMQRSAGVAVFGLLAKIMSKTGVHH